jgi:hypothetical protein
MNETQLKKFECTKAEAQKILYRFCEETLSLNYTAKDIERAYKAKKITKMGHQLFSHFRGLNRKMAESFVKAYKLLDPIKKKKIKKLAENLDSQERWTIS